ncbi:hypothetical protein BDV95DRAFT_208403 [Massariosphaeria phaeospora]|uniref:Zn(2)-C6 fungal-type domain-containing protein n=1 Tax=Massariosphaeria phaeospora TaxID=100035 RepID=A0A7C8HZJ0_9PLEO|nr:hypothetical protein BDV95DRAFT_208403 [Massariosphaeria phaeospora]
MRFTSSRSRPQARLPFLVASGLMATIARFQVLSLQGRDSRLRDYKHRKAHSKVRSGCVACRTKRVKCDEIKPACRRCQRNGRCCMYSLPRETDIPRISAVTVVPYDCPSARHGTSSTHLIQHMQREWPEIFLFGRNETLVSLFQANDLVRHTMLAVVACHIRHLSPRTVQHRIAEHFQQSLALEEYQRALNIRYSLDQDGVHALVFSAGLLNMVAYSLPGSDYDAAVLDPLTSWVFSERQDRLNWLALQAGLKPLLVSLSAHASSGIDFLGTIFFGPNKKTWALTRMGDQALQLPPLWSRAFNLASPNQPPGCDVQTNSTDEILRLPLLVLTQLRQLDAAGPHTLAQLQFMGKVDARFQKMLFERDERALWIYGYWFGLVCRYGGSWWCRERAMRDYRAIRIWLGGLCLGERPGEEGRLWRAMLEEYDAAPFL